MSPPVTSPSNSSRSSSTSSSPGPRSSASSLPRSLSSSSQSSATSDVSASHAESAPQLLLTGGAGFVGSAIIKALVGLHPTWHIAVVDRRPAEAGVLPLELLTKPGAATEPGKGRIEYIQADILNPADAEQVMQKVAPDCVIHTAGIVPGGLQRYNTEQLQLVNEVNVDATKIMLDVSKKQRSVRAFVLTGSCTCIIDDLDHEYPNFDETVPIPDKALIYGKSKGVAEKLVVAANDPANKFYTTSIRPSAILGREDYQLIPAVHACIAKWETPFIIGNGDNLYDFTFIDNVAWAHVLAVENLLLLPLSSQSPTAYPHYPAPTVPLQAVKVDPATREVHPSAAGQAILISNAQVITFRDFCLAVWAQFDHVPAFTVPIPVSLAYFVGFASEIVSAMSGIRTTLCRGSVKDAIGTRYCDLTRARQLLGYEPIVDLWDGVRISCDAYKIRLEQEKQKKLVK